ncbi:MAG: CTP synthase, partial [Dehalococcoidales bacterium]|nr:CTP synthase [Dehalococcoidales bacterium]
GDFLGGTIQIVPHLTNEIKDRFKRLAEKSKADVILIEVGGTVGDIEGQPFLEAIRQMRKDVGRNNVLYIHVTFLPFLASTQELKTKPTQHSVNELRRIGIQPDIIICRSDYPIADNIRDKISLFCDVEREAVIPLPTVSTIYEIPLILEEAGMGKLITEKLDLKTQESELSRWQDLVTCIKTCSETVNIALVGKYVELTDAYYSVREALYHAALFHNKKLNMLWVHSEDLDKADMDAVLRTAQGIVVPGGFGIRGIEGMIKAARYARERNVPYFGLCLGMQVMVIEFARHVLKSDEPNSTEFNPDTRYPVIDFMPEQKKIQSKGATMRLGNYPCHLLPGSLAERAYGEPIIYERHRHRYEFNNDYRKVLHEAGMIYSGVSPDDKLVEICEMAKHPWMLGSQFHPEFRSRPNRPQPLFRDFIGVAKDVLREGAQPPLPLSA